MGLILSIIILMRNKKDKNYECVAFEMNIVCYWSGVEMDQNTFT